MSQTLYYVTGEDAPFGLYCTSLASNEFLKQNKFSKFHPRAVAAIFEFLGELCPQIIGLEPLAASVKVLLAKYKGVDHELLGGKKPSRRASAIAWQKVLGEEETTRRKWREAQ